MSVTLFALTINGKTTVFLDGILHSLYVNGWSDDIFFSIMNGSS